MKKALALLVLFYGIVVWASVTVTVNGTNYTIPQTGEKGWGTNVTAWIQAMSANTLQPTGGVFTLSADVDFGSSFGLSALYFKSKTASIASAGVLRLAHGDTFGFRNNANTGDLLFSVNSSDQLLFNSAILPTPTNATFQDSTFNLYDELDSTKKLAFELSGITTANTRTLTIPDASTTIAGTDATQTLTNKTIAFGSNTFTGQLGVANGGTGQASAGTSEQTLVSNGTVFAPSASGRLLIGATDIGNAANGVVIDGSTSGSVYAYQAGQDTTHNITFGWIDNATAGSADAFIETYASTNPLLIQRWGGNTTFGSTTNGTNEVDVNGGMSIGTYKATIAPTNGLIVTGDVGIGKSSAATALDVNGTVTIDGSTSGAIAIVPQAVAGTYNFNLPTTVGTAGQVLTSQAGGATAMTWSSVVTNPMTTLGDEIYGGASGAPTRLAGPTAANTYFLSSIGTGSAAQAPNWQQDKAPTQQIFTSGGGTYTTASGVLWIKVRLVGAGGGAQGGGTSLTAGTAGGNTTFGTSFLTGNGGAAGQSGGAATGGDINVTGGDGGGGGGGNSSGGTGNYGGVGASSYFGGGGYSGGNAPTAGGTGHAYGSGGGGGGGDSTHQAGYGGGAGGYVEKIITSPAATYAYVVGVGGTGGASSTGGGAGGNGANGIIIVEEHYQ